MSNELRLPDNEELASQIIESEHKKFEMTARAGVLGRFFGSEEHVGRNVAGLLVLMLATAGLGYTVLEKSLPAKDLWGIIGPLIGTSLGYMFGRGAGKR